MNSTAYNRTEARSHVFRIKQGNPSETINGVIVAAERRTKGRFGSLSFPIFPPNYRAEDYVNFILTLPKSSSSRTGVTWPNFRFPLTIPTRRDYLKGQMS